MLIALTVKSYEFIIIETDKAGLLIKIAPETLPMFIKGSEYRSFTNKLPTVKLSSRCSTSQTSFTSKNEIKRLYKLPAMAQGEHANYCNLIALVNNALGLHDLGDHRDDTLNENLCSHLGISSFVVLYELETLMQTNHEIESSIKQLAI